MSHIKVNTNNRFPLFVHNSSTALTNITLNAAGETTCMIGHLVLENPEGGSKTLSAAGGGSIVWRSGTTTFANAGTTFKVGIQDVSTATSPAQGDGTFDVEASFTGGGGGVTSGAVQTSVMTSGTKTIAHGDLIAITFAMTARGGADSVIVNANHPGIYGSTPNMPTVTDNTGGTYAKTSTALPNAYILFNDGTIGWLYGAPFVSASVASVAFNSGTATADEYGNIIYPEATYKASGVSLTIFLAGASSDFELILYSDPLGTPVAERTVTIDATQVGATATAQIEALFSSPYTLKANTTYAVTCRPTTANNVTNYYFDANNATGAKAGLCGNSHYACRRLDNSGAFSDYNGGTAKTRMMLISLIGIYREQGVNMCSGQVGVY